MRAPIRKASIAALVMLAATLFITGCPRDESYTVVRGDITGLLTTDGTVVAPPNEYAAIECAHCAPVSRIFATVGQTLSAGDVIVELSHPDVSAALDAAQADLRRARQTLEQTRQQYEADIEAARSELHAAQSVERSARAQLQQAQAPSEGELENMQGEAAAPPPPPPANDTAYRVAFTRAHERRLRMEQRLEAAQERASEALEPSRREVAAAEQLVSAAQAQQRAAMIRTPIDGQLIELNVGHGDEPGQVGGVTAVVADLATLRVHARLSDAQASLVESGMPAHIAVPAIPDVIFEGEVERINTRIERPGTQFTRDFVAVIPFTNEMGQAKPYMEAEVAIELGTATDVLLVRVEALQYDEEGLPFVEFRIDNRWDRRDVVPGLSDGEYVEIREGVEAGEVVRVVPASADDPPAETV